ncbi:MAG TPA: histidinol-phosphate transaminase [Polyangia bacterium]|nr:histidinol-phosphate transaminase [Polyangia bacterium]
MSGTTPRPRPAIESMTAYTPGEQPGPGERFIKLNTNENPYPPSPRVMEAIRALDGEALRRYPNPMADGFRAVAARVHGVSPDMILAGNGSDEILAMVMRAFVGPGDVLAYPHPTYSLYPVLAEMAEVKVVEVPWGPAWSLPAQALIDTGARAIFFANPNAPSGTLVGPDQVRALADRFRGVLLVDEAYVDFAESDCLALVKSCPNVVISRTFSKGYSLAGLRFGYAVAAPSIIEAMAKVKDSYNCDALSMTAATAALEDQAHARGGWQAVREERERLAAELGRRGFAVIPSQANFLLATVPGGDAAALYAKLKAHGILIRYFAKPGLDDKVRITIGTREQNDALLAAL